MIKIRNILIGLFTLTVLGCNLTKTHRNCNFSNMYNLELYNFTQDTLFFPLSNQVLKCKDFYYFYIDENNFSIVNDTLKVEVGLKNQNIGTSGNTSEGSVKIDTVRLKDKTILPKNFYIYQLVFSINLLDNNIKYIYIYRNSLYYIFSNIGGKWICSYE